MILFERLREKLAGLDWEQLGKIAVFTATVVILSATLSTVLFELVSPMPREQGEVAPYTVRAPRDFLIEDKLATEKQRAEATARVPAVFTINDNAAREAAKQLEAMFAALQERAGDYDAKRAVDDDRLVKARAGFEQRFNLNLVGAEWDVVLDPAMWPVLSEAVLSIISPLLERGIIGNKSQLKPLLKGERKPVLMSASTRVDREIEAEHALLSSKEALEAAKAGLPAHGFGRGSAFDSAVEKIALLHLKPNVLYNLQETEKRLRAAQSTVEPIYYRIKRNEVIVRAGDVITATQERRLKQLQEEIVSGGLLYTWLGYAVLAALVLLSVYTFAHHVWPSQPFTARDLFVGSLTLVGSFFLIKLFSIIADSLSNTFFYFDPSTFVLAAPLAAGGILLQVTIGSPAVFMFVLSFALLSGVFLANSWLVMVLIVAGNIVGSLAVHNCSRRSAFIYASLRVAAVNVLAVLCFLFLFPEYTAAEAANRLIWALVGGLMSGVLAAGLTPIAEFFGGYATDIKLLELASLDQPLLRDFSVQAPGTWNHCVVLGQIAEAAAEAIGAHPLLARVGAYYHDIGKTGKPAYFVENQTQENRHDRLTPSMSALIIKSHVKEGMDLAQHSGMPRKIIDFIPQHHGTSLIKYFYEKALAEADEGETVDENQYRYEGPRPQSREAAILMLGDAVEAASRTLADPSPAKIQGLVQKIINNIFASGELDESNLTLKDLHLIAKSFTRVLTGIYHRRVEYSEPAEKTRDARQPKAAKNTPGAMTNGDKPKGELTENGKNGGGLAGEGENGQKAPDSLAKKPDTADSKEALKRLGL